MIIAKNIQKNYDKLKVLKGVDIHINKGEIISSLGLQVPEKQPYFKF